MSVIGIDLGTTNSLVCYFDGEKSTLIPNALGELLTPSVVSYDDKTNELLFGKIAKDRLVSHPALTAACFKRAMGTNYQYKLGKKAFSAVELSALLLKQLKADAQAHLGHEVSEAIISVPAYFSDGQRNATKQAGQLAGLKVSRLINEPTAAALAYGVIDNSEEQMFMVVDMGGGTLDISILDVFESVVEVRASAGDNYLGGEDFSLALRDKFIEDNRIKLKKLSGADLGRLATQIDKMKHTLSRAHEAEFAIELQGKDYQFALTRDEFQQIIKPLIKRFVAPIERAMRDSDLSPNELDNVFLVGGATRMPWIRAEVSKLFKLMPMSHIDPDQVVGLGTGVQVALKNRDSAIDDIVLTDVCPYTLGVSMAVETGRNQHESGHFLPIIERNMTVPISREERLYTLHDNQTKVVCTVYQGESRLTKNNVELGEVEVTVPKAKAGEQYVDIRFTYDINGILEVIVNVGEDGETKRAIINNGNTHLSDAEIDASMAKLAELKIHPRDNEENRQIVARLERLYEEYIGDHRPFIASVLRSFEQALNTQNIDIIAQVKEDTVAIIKEYEKI